MSKRALLISHFHRIATTLSTMANQTIEFTTDKRFVRRARELETIEAMLRMYCRSHGHPPQEPL